jgi:hypothetical protein
VAKVQANHSLDVSPTSMWAAYYSREGEGEKQFPLFVCYDNVKDNGSSGVRPNGQPLYRERYGVAYFPCPKIRSSTQFIPLINYHSHLPTHPTPPLKHK